MEPVAKLVDFCHVLRGLGLRIGVTEMMDAAHALLLVNWSSRELFKLSLQATLVKKSADVLVFERAFQHFFVDWDTQRKYQQVIEQTCMQRDEEIRKSESDLTFQGNKLNIPDELKRVYARLPSQEQQHLQSFLDQTSCGNRVESKFQPIVEKMLAGSLEYWRRQLAEPLYPFNPSGDSQTDHIVSLVVQELTKTEQALLYRDMGRISDDEITSMAKLIKKMAQMLATQISRKYRRSNRTQRIDFRKSIRRNMMYGGVLLKFKYKSLSRHKPNILLLCDVSGSMSRYAAFVLQFIYGLSNLAFNIESFIFAENLERMTPYFSHKRPFVEIMSELMTKSSQWGKGTDLHNSLAALSKQYPGVLRPSTVLVVVSDTLTLHCEAAVNELQKIKLKIKKIVWLNTLSRTEWARQKSVLHFQKVSNMFACNTLLDLSNIGRKHIFSKIN